MKSLLFTVIPVTLLAWLGFCGYLYWFQRSMIYFPALAQPGRAGTGSSLILDSTGERILVDVINPGRRDAVLYFGGNAEFVTDSASYWATLFPGHSIYLMHYRGYGGSSGSPDEQGLYTDALALYDLVAEGHDNMNVIGRSLGSGVATYLASERKIHRLVLTSPFDSLVQVASALYPMFPVSLLLKDRYDSLSRAHTIQVPVLILIAEKDAVIAPKHAHALAEALSVEQRQVHVLDGVGHNDIGAHARYNELLGGFINTDGN